MTTIRALLRRCNIQSDTLGTYRNSSTLTSVIGTDGTWAVDSYYVQKATRTIYLNFSQPIATTGPGGGSPVAPPSGYYKARIGTECYRYNNSLWTVPPGQTVPCPMNVHFDYGGKTYDLHMSQYNANFPETNFVNVTCIYPTTGTASCMQWRISPSAAYLAPDGTTQYRNIANLSQEVTVKGTLTYVKQGDFYVSFSIIVKNP